MKYSSTRALALYQLSSSSFFKPRKMKIPWSLLYAVLICLGREFEAVTTAFVKGEGQSSGASLQAQPY